jgi:hypothetical protein
LNYFTENEVIAQKYNIFLFFSIFAGHEI